MYMLLQSGELFSLSIFRYESTAESFNKPELKSDARNFQGATLFICSKHCPAEPSCKCPQDERCSGSLSPVQTAAERANLPSQHTRRRKQRLGFRGFVLHFQGLSCKLVPSPALPPCLARLRSCCQGWRPRQGGGQPSANISSIITAF